MGELAASIAHEIMQPLTGIVTSGNACLNWLATAPPNIAKVRTTVERIIRDGNRASEVVNDIRALVKKAAPRQEPVDVNDLISRTLTLASGEMTQNRVELQTDLEADLPKVFGDPVQLQQVLLNLIINAIEAMSSVSDRPRVLMIRSEGRELPESKAPGNVAVILQDSGVGLDPQQADRLFDAFCTTKPEGMGMGLAICRTVISAHGGQVSAANNAACGATFEFTLPAHAESAEKVEIATA
jgi:C4-dicarboxylate-specific signal transduction histidine kinase